MSVGTLPTLIDSSTAFNHKESIAQSGLYEQKKSISK